MPGQVRRDPVDARRDGAAVDKVRFVGDPVARSPPSTGDGAARSHLIEVDYRLLRQLFDPAEALRRTDVQIHEGNSTGTSPRR